MKKSIRLGLVLFITAPLFIDRLQRSAVWEPGDAFSSIVGIVLLIALLVLYLLDKRARSFPSPSTGEQDTTQSL